MRRQGVVWFLKGRDVRLWLWLNCKFAASVEVWSNQRPLDAQVIVLWNDKPQNKRKILLEGGLVDLTDTHSQNEVSM